MAVRVMPRITTKTKQYTVEDIRVLERDPVTEHRYFYVIDGELLEDPMTTKVHSILKMTVGFYLKLWVLERDLGHVMTEANHYLTNADNTVLRPDVAYNSHARLASTPDYSYIRAMPEIAVEIKSPSNTYAQLQRKAQAYLRHGSTLVWLVFPEREGVEVWLKDEYGDMQSQFVDRHGALRGDPALPGFTLELSKLFPPEND